MKLVVIYGPPGAGKLTVAQELSDLTGYKLFHNHLTVNAVRALFEFGSPEFKRVLWRIRLDVLSEAARSGIDTILTLNSASPNSQLLQQTQELSKVVREEGGEVCFVNLTPSRETLESRVSQTSRSDHGKLMDISRLRELLLHWNGQPLRDSDLTIDNSDRPANEVARFICDYYKL